MICRTKANGRKHSREDLKPECVTITDQQAVLELASHLKPIADNLGVTLFGSDAIGQFIVQNPTAFRQEMAESNGNPLSENDDVQTTNDSNSNADTEITTQVVRHLEKVMDKAGKRVYDISDKTEEEVLDPDNQLHIIGEKGAAAMDAMEEVTTRIDKLAVAKKMETSGKDAKIIKWATGWEKGIDGKWRYEIMDVSIKSDIAIRLKNKTWGKKASDFKPFKLTKFFRE